jgi:putative ABC transport system ATP-binding protein
METSIIMAENLSKRFGSGHTEVKAVNNTPLSVRPKEMVLIMGPSGSGKTTLLSMLGALPTPSEGKIHIDGTEITALDEKKLPEIRALKIGFIFQAFNLLEALSVEENILFPARLRKGGVDAAKPRAEELMARLGLLHRRNSLPRSLSGGEKQRVAIARALINEPMIILADEPTGNLDSKSGQEVLMILHDIARDDRCSVVIVTHDPRVEEIADRILWLDDGELHDRKAEDHSWVRDPVCGMRVDEWTSTIESEHKGKKYAFCSERCKERFDNSPGEYIETGNGQEGDHEEH